MADPRDAETAYAVEEEGLAAIQQGQMLALMEMAQRHRRDVPHAMKQVRDFACLDEETAVGCFFRLPGGIEGPSIRFAEILSSLWPNSMTATRLVTVGQRQVVVEGVFIDTENRRAHREEAVRQIVDKRGKRYSDDLIRKTIGAAASVALRNAILRAIPRALYQPALAAAKQMAMGKVSDLEVNRRKALQAYMVLGIGEDRILSALNVRTVEQITREMVADLRANYVAIKDGSVDPEDAYPHLEKPEEGKPAPAGKPAPTEAAHVSEAAPEGVKADVAREALAKRFTLLRMQDPDLATRVLGAANAAMQPADMSTEQLQGYVAELENAASETGGGE